MLAEPANYDDKWLNYWPFIDEHIGWVEKVYIDVVVCTKDLFEKY